MGLDDSLFYKTPVITPKDQTVQPAAVMHLKIPLLNRGLNLSSSKSAFAVSALHFFVK
jgi:hypothetical protein